LALGYLFTPPYTQRKKPYQSRGPQFLLLQVGHT
jgi:hypothetical protein